MTIVTPSKWLKNLVKQSFLSRYDVVVINNGVNGDAFSIKARYTALPEYLNGSEYVLGVALPFGERKGFSDFMRLRKELTDKYRIVMVGLSDKQIAALPPGITGIRRTNDVHALAALYALDGRAESLDRARARALRVVEGFRSTFASGAGEKGMPSPRTRKKGSTPYPSRMGRLV